jgi:hypothetical protein
VARKWLTRDALGQPHCYSEYYRNYYRLRPCLTHPAFINYVKRMALHAVRYGGSRWLHFDNCAQMQVPAALVPSPEEGRASAIPTRRFQSSQTPAGGDVSVAPSGRDHQRRGSNLRPRSDGSSKRSCPRAVQVSFWPIGGGKSVNGGVACTRIGHMTTPNVPDQ